jgi:hypothetical protein
VNSWFSSHRFALSFVAAALALSLAGCGRNDVQVYQVGKEQAQSPPAQGADATAMPPGHPDVSAQPPGLKWTLPTGWEEVVPPGQMRVASFRIKGEGSKLGDVSVVPLPGAAGGILANVNRWRGQVGLAPVSEAELGNLAQKVVIAGHPGELYEQAGQGTGSGEPTRILAAILMHDEVAWFFKVTGDDQLVAQQKPAFVEFLKSLTFTAPAAPVAQAGLPADHPPIDTPMLSAQPADATAPASGKPAWQVPAAWKEVPGGQFLVAKFTISGDGGAQAAVNVSMSAGDGGGLAANVGRWRGQLGLGQLSEDELNKLAAPVDTAAGKAMLVDMIGTDARTGQKARLVGVIVPQGGQTWFYKLMGDEQLVGREKDAFSKFVQTARY